MVRSDTEKVGEEEMSDLTQLAGWDEETKRKRENDDGYDKIPEPKKLKLSSIRSRPQSSSRSGVLQSSSRSGVLPIAGGPQRMLTRLNIGTPNWGDNPSLEARRLVDIALEGYHAGQARCVSKDAITFAWTEFSFGGALHINSFVDGGIWCHINFKGKIKVQAPDSAMRDSGPFLFFAELKREHGQSEFTLVSCENLGVFSSVYRPKLNGCKACDKDPHRIVLMHGRYAFTVGSMPEFDVR